MTRPALGNRVEISDALGELMSMARHAMRVVGDGTMTSTERVVAAANVARGVLGEVRSAYAEQTSALLRRVGSAPNYRLSLDDLIFAERWSAYLAYRAELAEWQDVPENRAALAVEAACTQPQQVPFLPDEVKTRLDSRPAPVRECRLGDAPQGWPATIQLWSWSTTFDHLLQARRAMAGVLFREPGEDDEDAAGAGSGGT